MKTPNYAKCDITRVAKYSAAFGYSEMRVSLVEPTQGSKSAPLLELEITEDNQNATFRADKAQLQDIINMLQFAVEKL